MFQTSPCCICPRHSARRSAWRATIDSPRVPRTMSFSSAKEGEAAVTRAPSDRNTRVAPAATRATSASTGSRPPRSGVQATRHPWIDGRRTAAAIARVSTS